MYAVIIARQRTNSAMLIAFLRQSIPPSAPTCVETVVHIVKIFRALCRTYKLF